MLFGRSPRGLFLQGRFILFYRSSPLFFLLFFHLTYSRWTSSLPSCLWSQRIFPSLTGSRLTIFLSRCKSSTLTTRHQWLNFTDSRSHAFRCERKNSNPTLVRIELTTSVLADVQLRLSYPRGDRFLQKKYIPPRGELRAYYGI